LAASVGYEAPTWAITALANASTFAFGTSA
jgi:hypothetical protein